MTANQSEPTDQVFTCPFHPEVLRKHAGRCPMCGAKLEPTGRGQQAPLAR